MQPRDIEMEIVYCGICPLREGFICGTGWTSNILKNEPGTMLVVSLIVSLEFILLFFSSRLGFGFHRFFLFCKVPFDT